MEAERVDGLGQLLLRGVQVHLGSRVQVLHLRDWDLVATASFCIGIEQQQGEEEGKSG